MKEIAKKAEKNYTVSATSKKSDDIKALKSEIIKETLAHELAHVCFPYSANKYTENSKKSFIKWIILRKNAADDNKLLTRMCDDHLQSKKTKLCSKGSWHEEHNPNGHFACEIEILVNQ